MVLLSPCPGGFRFGKRKQQFFLFEILLLSSLCLLSGDCIAVAGCNIHIFWWLKCCHYVAVLCFHAYCHVWPVCQCRHTVTWTNKFNYFTVSCLIYFSVCYIHGSVLFSCNVLCYLAFCSFVRNGWCVFWDWRKGRIDLAEVLLSSASGFAVVLGFDNVRILFG